MSMYRMAMRAGSQGQDLWPLCCKLGVAAITYEPLARTDLSQHPQGEPASLWAQLYPTQVASLRRVAYEMKEGDVIFVKQGPRIVGKGIVTGSYNFNHALKVHGVRIVDEFGTPWPHQVPVQWATDFAKVDVLLGSEQLTVKSLNQDEMTIIRHLESEENRELNRISAKEGNVYKAEANFRSRNRALIAIKKAMSGCICEVCDFDFEAYYGDIGKGYIIAHHLKLVASGPTITTLDDIALVCANCHAMIHSKDPPIPISEMRRIVAKRSKIHNRS